MDFTIVYCVTLTSYGKALYLHFYYLTIWTHCTCMYVYILSEIKFYYYYYYTAVDEHKHMRGENILEPRKPRDYKDTLFTCCRFAYSMIMV